MCQAIMILDDRNIKNYASKWYKQSLVPADVIGKWII